MSGFEFKQWLLRNRVGAYSKVPLQESLDSENAFADDTENREDMEEVDRAAVETVGWATIEKPSDNLLDVYINKLNNYDWYYRKSSNPVDYSRGIEGEEILKRIYAHLSDEDKEKALHVYKGVSRKHYPELQYPLAAKTRETLTIQTFTGI